MPFENFADRHNGKEGFVGVRVDPIQDTGLADRRGLRRHGILAVAEERVFGKDGMDTAARV